MMLKMHEIMSAADEYRECKNPARRKEIILMIHAAGGPPALESLGLALKMEDPEVVTNWAEEYYRQRNRWRRKRKPIFLPPPPVPPGPERITAKDVHDVAVEVALRGRNEPLAVNRKDLELLAADLLHPGEKLIIR